jgi:hypothetical protein
VDLTVRIWYCEWATISIQHRWSNLSWTDPTDRARLLPKAEPRRRAPKATEAHQRTRPTVNPRLIHAPESVSMNTRLLRVTWITPNHEPLRPGPCLRRSTDSRRNHYGDEKLAHPSLWFRRVRRSTSFLRHCEATRPNSRPRIVPPCIQLWISELRDTILRDGSGLRGRAPRFLFKVGDCNWQHGPICLSPRNEKGLRRGVRQTVWCHRTDRADAAERRIPTARVWSPD